MLHLKHMCRPIELSLFNCKCIGIRLKHVRLVFVMGDHDELGNVTYISDPAAIDGMVDVGRLL
jgi:hypothetical protein